MRESVIQSQVIKYLEKIGWYVVKIIQTNKNGWPDLQAHKDGITIFIEVKSENGKVSQLQQYRHKQLTDAGFKVLVIYSLKQITNEFSSTIGSQL